MSGRTTAMSGFAAPVLRRDQVVLWPQRLDEAVPWDAMVRRLDEVLRSEAFAPLFAEWRGDYVLLEGREPFHPRYLAGLYLYGMLNRLRSSRQLEKACRNDLHVIWLMERQEPDHSTIARFVVKHGKRLRKLFREVLEVGIRARLVTLSHTAIDGTKMGADAGKGSVRSEETIEKQLSRLDETIAKLEAEWEENEKRDPVLIAGAPAKNLSEKKRLAGMKRQQERIGRALATIRRRREENPAGPTPKAIASLTDPDRRVMPDKEGKSKPNYNGQLVVDADCGIIVAAAVNDQADDSGQLVPMLREVEKTCGCLPDEVSADSNYNTGPELATLETMETIAYLLDNGKNSGSSGRSPEQAEALAAAHRGEGLTEAQWSALPRDGKGRIEKSAFTYDAEHDVYRCPAGGVLVFLRTSQDMKKSGKVVRRQYGGCGSCASCPHAATCCSDPSKGRTVNRDQYEEHRARMRARMDSDVGRKRYKLRGETVEPRFGHIKHALGIRRFMRRGIEAVTTEWLMICTAVNLGVLLRHWDQVRAVL